MMATSIKKKFGWKKKARRWDLNAGSTHLMVMVGSFSQLLPVHTDNVVGPSWESCNHKVIWSSYDFVIMKSKGHQSRTWSTQAPSLPASVSNQWVPLLGESPPTHLGGKKVGNFRRHFSKQWAMGSSPTNLGKKAHIVLQHLHRARIKHFHLEWPSF